MILTMKTHGSAWWGPRKQGTSNTMSKLTRKTTKRTKSKFLCICSSVMSCLKIFWFSPFLLQALLQLANAYSDSAKIWNTYWGSTKANTRITNESYEHSRFISNFLHKTNYHAYRINCLEEQVRFNIRGVPLWWLKRIE